MSEMDSVFQGYGVQITLPDDDSFLKVKETLQRIGIPSYKDGKTLYQSCHILHKRGEYAILSFLELFSLDGRKSTFSEEDRARRDNIVLMLEEWNLVKINPTDKKKILANKESYVRLKVISHKEKSSWKLVSKYQVGKK